MKSKKNRLGGSSLYLILDKKACGNKNIYRILKSAIEGGIDLIQVRDKISSTKEMVAYCRALKKIARKNGLPIIINDRLDVCLAIDADGIHLGQEDMPVETARRALGPKKIIGLSCHTTKEIKDGLCKEIDYLSFGPAFKTRTKPGLSAKGPCAIKKNKKHFKIPTFLIGGINTSTIKKLPYIGDFGLAVCSQICKAKLPKSPL